MAIVEAEVVPLCFTASSSHENLPLPNPCVQHTDNYMIFVVCFIDGINTSLKKKTKTGDIVYTIHTL